MSNLCNYINYKYPSIESLRIKAKKQIPKFAFDYLEGGCNEEINLNKNKTALASVELNPYYLNGVNEKVNIKTNLFGNIYNAPFGIAPIGLQGLIWPNAPEILAKAAAQKNIPFILSTVSTSSIEKIGDISNGKAWFQLYHPASEEITDDILRRLAASNYKVLVLLTDVPSFGYRHNDIINGLSMPPRFTLSNIKQTAFKFNWLRNTIQNGFPNFETLRPYMHKTYSLKQLGEFMNATFDGKLSEDKIARIRDKWKGKLVLKGVSTNYDVEKAIKLGIDGIIVSNHGGRQLDAAEASVTSLTNISAVNKGKLTIMMDGGVRSGVDIARSMACGSDFTFLGRPFMYGVAALGNKGGVHTINILEKQFVQVMEQLCCRTPSEITNHLIK